MPAAKLPSSLAGWLVTLVSSIVGFLAGFVVLAVAHRMTGGGS